MGQIPKNLFCGCKFIGFKLKHHYGVSESMPGGAIPRFATLYPSNEWQGADYLVPTCCRHPSCQGYVGLTILIVGEIVDNCLHALSSLLLL